MIRSMSGVYWIGRGRVCEDAQRKVRIVKITMRTHRDQLRAIN